MVVVPEFLIRRVYKKGSLKKLENGASVELKNVLGPGFISGFNYVKINDVIYEAENVKFITAGKELTKDDVSEENPLAFRLGQEGTLIMSGKESVVTGVNKIVIEAMNPEAGKVQLTVDDTVA
ncbi:hypothetical protein IJZ97_04720 [bacterium]|nr:hypothetical protein [bacterium]